MNMIRCFRDDHGFPRVELIDGHSNIGSFLEQDIQTSVEGCKAYLLATETVEAGDLSEWSGTGNAHTVTIRPVGVSIENTWDAGLGVAEMSIPQFQYCLETWIRFVSPQPNS